MALARIEKEFKDFEEYRKAELDLGFIVQKTCDPFHWVACIVGPRDTPYEGGKFWFDVRFPSNYPFKPPSCKMITKIFHCGWNSDGLECTARWDEWSPSMTVHRILQRYMFMMEFSNPSDPMVPEVAQLYLTDRLLHDGKAREWAKLYAGAPDCLHAVLQHAHTIDDNALIIVAFSTEALEFTVPLPGTWQDVANSVRSRTGDRMVQLHNPDGTTLDLRDPISATPITTQLVKRPATAHAGRLVLRSILQDVIPEPYEDTPEVAAAKIWSAKSARCV